MVGSLANFMRGAAAAAPPPAASAAAPALPPYLLPFPRASMQRTLDALPSMAVLTALNARDDLALVTAISAVAAGADACAPAVAALRRACGLDGGAAMEPALRNCAANCATARAWVVCIDEVLTTVLVRLDAVPRAEAVAARELR